jgi:hypothetical protein
MPGPSRQAQSHRLETGKFKKVGGHGRQVSDAARKGPAPPSACETHDSAVQCQARYRCRLWAETVPFIRIRLDNSSDRGGLAFVPAWFCAATGVNCAGGYRRLC